MGISKTIGFSHKLLDVDSKQGIAVFYLNSYDVKDSDGDISDKTSFNRTIKNDFSRQKHLINHNGLLNVGLPKEYVSDDFGLKVVSQINMKKEIGRDLFSDYELHASLDRSMEHSFGYNVMQRDTKDKSRILEYKMWEYTTMTTWGANSLTPQVDLKELDRDDIIDSIYYISEAFKKATFTDAKFKKLETHMADLINAYKLIKDSQTPVVVTEQSNDYNEALNYFKESLKTL